MCFTSVLFCSEGNCRDDVDGVVVRVVVLALYDDDDGDDDDDTDDGGVGGDDVDSVVVRVVVLALYQPVLSKPLTVCTPSSISSSEDEGEISQACINL